MFTDQKYFEGKDTKITVHPKKHNNSIVELKPNADMSEFKSEADIIE